LLGRGTASKERRNNMPTRKPSILIVEDDVEIRLLLCRILEESGYMVRLAADGFAALEEMRTDSPDVLLSDLYMPGISGFELLAMVRREFPMTRVVAMSGAFAGDEVPAGVLADAFYAKATNVVDLLQIIEAMTGFDVSQAAVPN
jgi:CheY-like chemotaxis protein